MEQIDQNIQACCDDDITPDDADISQILQLQDQIRHLNSQKREEAMKKFISETPWKAMSRLQSPNQKSDRSIPQLNEITNFFQERSTHQDLSKLHRQKCELRNKFNHFKTTPRPDHWAKNEKNISGPITKEELIKTARTLKMKKL